jgi:GT2 family glycosyltransferase
VNLGRSGAEIRCSVVIPTLHRQERLRRTLDSIVRCTPSPDEVVVVDGDPGGSSRDVVESFAGLLQIRHMVTDPGSTRQRNHGIAVVTGDVIVFFDDDVDVDPGVFAVLRDAYADPSIVGMTGRVIEQEQRDVVGKHSPLRRFFPGGGTEGSFTRYGYPRRLIHLDQPRDLHFMHGSFMSGRAKDVRAVLFDEHLKGYALAEDEDFSYRLSRRGRIAYRPDAIVHHEKSGATGADARKFGRLVVVNRHYLFHKNFAVTLLARLQFGLLIAMLFAHRVLNREWQGAVGIIEGTGDIWFRRR